MNEQCKHSSTLQNQNCTASNGITAYTSMGFTFSNHENKKEVLLFTSRAIFCSETISSSVTQKRIYNPFLSSQILQLLEIPH